MTKVFYLITAVFLVSVYLSTASSHTTTTDAAVAGATHNASKALFHFAMNMYQKISERMTEDNMVFSPISIYTVLTILMPGLAGNSRKQVANALNMHEMARPLREENLLCQSVFTTNDSYNLTDVNRIYIDQTFQLYKSYKAFSKRSHSSSVKKIDFKTDPQRSLKKINRFVSKATKGQIDHLLPDDAIDEQTLMVLINTIHMEAAWNFPFRAIDQHFFVSANENISIAAMRTNPHAKCGLWSERNDLFRVAKLPFKDEKLSMVIFMPTEKGNFNALEQPDSTTVIGRVLHELNGSERQCTITMPKFSIKHKIDDLQSILEDMGIRDIFHENEGDFSRMTRDHEGLYVSDFRHEAVIRLNETGVTASAASSVVTSFRMSPAQVVIDKPFLFIIRHEITGAVLFIGRVTRPHFEE